MFGVCVVSFVSVIHAMLQSYSSMAALRLSTLPDIPLALVYSIFILFIFEGFFRFFVLVFLFDVFESNVFCFRWVLFLFGFLCLFCCFHVV